ncbi:Histone acetyltransferases subunit 3 family protein [Candida albicans]|uniref:Histone acetyltransferases subunit 3 family protein n=1 Tax=Candida albicans TaxID=5476 RepID=A0A8H6F5W4_CANAX|nr:Histone acetyltransferases subunit 3 family protein [Candida albicans]
MTDAHSVSTTLDDIINELKLTYDSSVDEVESIDSDVLNKIRTIKESEIKSDSKTSENDKKRKNEELTPEHQDDEDEVPMSATKKRKIVAAAKEADAKEEKDLVSEADGKVEDELDEKEEKENLNSKDDPIPPNPKSEYVEPQTLSASAIAELGLFSEENNGLETQGREYLKKKYGVASYPERDLQDLLPGEIPNIDFSKNKPPSNQVQFTTFQSYIESYFRPYSTEDIKFLKERNVVPPGFEKQGYDADVTPFIIPKLGKFYADLWSEEDSTLGSKLNSPAFQQPSSDSYKPKGSIEGLTDEALFTEDISCGPLSNRLLSAILSNREGGLSDEEDAPANDSKSETKDASKSSLAEEEVATQLNSEEDYKLSAEQNDFQTIEERLKRELKYIGIFMNLPTTGESKPKAKQANGRAAKKISASIIDNDEWIKNKEDDEVCAEIRKLQRELKEVTSRNRANRKKLIPLVEEHIAYQEYCAILEDLDKQVDSAYMKRLKGKGKKKRSDVVTPQQQALNSGLRALLEKRRRWIDNIGKLFPVAEKMKRVPSESILIREGVVESEQVDDDNNENTSPAVDMLTQKSL